MNEFEPILKQKTKQKRSVTTLILCKLSNECLNRNIKCEKCINNELLYSDYFDSGYNLKCNKDKCIYNRQNKCQYKKDCNDIEKCQDFTMQ